MNSKHIMVFLSVFFAGLLAVCLIYGFVGLVIWNVVKMVWYVINHLVK